MQNDAGSNLPDAFSKISERKIIFLLCILAAIHVFIFSAAFPFFNNVDELAHFDMVVKYSHGHVPRHFENLSAEAAQYISIYSSSAYFGSTNNFPGGKFPPPPWTQPFEKVRGELLADEIAWQHVQNYESSQPPLYYAVAGLWWNAGHWIGLQNGFLLYWLRFLNILVIASLVWLGYIAARIIFPENLFLRLGVPALIAFFPQTAFYSIESDAFSPLCFGAAFVCLLFFWRAETPRVGLGIAIGLALAATFLTKMTNIPFLAVSIIFVLNKIYRLTKSGKLLKSIPSFISLALSAGVPAILWIIWCKIHFGDLTGSSEKAKFFDWVIKPFSQWWHHPVFTPHGFWIFFSSLIATFWQSEFLWHSHPLSLPAVDLVYVILTIAFIGVALINLFLKSKILPKLQSLELWFCFWILVTAVAYMIFLSIIFDFGNEHNPSRARPYFTAGRMILGALIPFLLLYLYGVDCILSRVKNKWSRPAALTIMILFMLISEIAVDWPVFSNEYNWFHLS